MAHLSLYRRFRPDTFDKMVRQEHVVRVLKNQIESGSVGHAYLFCGPRGTGKTSVARIFARSVNCEHPVDGSPCGECPTCLALKRDSLDIVEIDAASNNGVAEMRDLREKVQYPPVSGRYKVYIIDEVHMLTDSAFNALLKTLEEPPVHAIFILATTEPHKIPATILSRCMRLDFKLIPEEDLERHLCSVLDEIGKPYEREAVSAIARAGAGSDRDMLSIAEMCISYGDKLTYDGVTAALGTADFNETSSLCEAILGADVSTALESTERILSEGKAVGVLCRDLLSLLNQISIVKTCKGAERLLSLPQAHYERLAQIAERSDGRAILRATEILAGTESELRLVSSPRICLETAIVRVSEPSAEYSIDALLVRVAALEKQIKEGVRVPVSEPVPADTAPVPPAPAEASQDFSEEYDFPAEEPVFEEAYFSDPVVQVGQKQAEPSVERESAPPLRQEPAAAPAAPAVGLTAELAFGKFIRLLRKTSRNGVLFTMCSDLEAVFEENILVLYTESGTVYRSLVREEHRTIMQDVFRQVGVEAFDVRMKGASPAPQGDGLKELRENFKDYPIEIK